MYMRHKRLRGIGFLIIERRMKGRMNWVLIGASRETEEEDADVSKSLPNSANFEPKSPHRVPQHWSSSCRAATVAAS
ncbi:hypothetical protein HanIR_Chr13g0669171 [Helianthus annuus]|nr:hypothetical protein HanIR_Chr13g0669081 [Helianthus annuus]KAJ0483844.1 hypothetical protein HanIR_Chr13g0669171 [Helianthus annuus]